jgi:hypothetical protein
VVEVYYIDFKIAGIGIRITSPVELTIPQEMLPFLASCSCPHVIYTVKLIDSPIIPAGSCVHSEAGTSTYSDGDRWLRLYAYLEGCDGVQAALRLRPDGHHTLYLPQSDIARYQSTNALSPILGLDYVMMQHNCMFLHSSLVRYQGKAVLFSGPSGIGKSTQADLWQKHLGAEILNGDKSCIAKRADGYHACGSPYAGSSDIFLPEEAPIAGIVLLKQGAENHIVSVSQRQAFVSLYAQLLANTWDSWYTDRLCCLLSDILANIPVYELTCTPDEDAVMLVRDTLYNI